MATDQKPSRAGYMRQYRATTRPMNEREAFAEGKSEGVESCTKFLREEIGQRAFSGYQLAQKIDKAMLAIEPSDVVRNREMVESMRPKDPSV